MEKEDTEHLQPGTLQASAMFVRFPGIGIHLLSQENQPCPLLPGERPEFYRVKC